MDGCLKGIFKLGCAILVIGALAGAWWFREPIMHTLASWFGRSTALPSTADTAVGAPTPKEIASLIGGGIDWNVRKMYDSLRVELQEGKLILHARLDTRALPPGTLGPFAGMFGEREPLRMAGTVSIGKPGTALYDITEISLRGIEIPGPFVKQITKQMAGASTSGAVPVKVDPAVTDVKVHLTGVVLYKRRRTGT